MHFMEDNPFVFPKQWRLILGAKNHLQLFIEVHNTSLVYPRACFNSQRIFPLNRYKKNHF